MIKRRIKHALERLTGLSINPTLTRGANLLYDLDYYLPTHPFKTLFDVGGNIGQTAVPLAKRFPDATIHSFEPVSHAFKQLSDAVARFPNVTCHNIALGASAGEATIAVDAFSSRSTIRAQPAADETQHTETVRIDTLEAIAQSLNTTQIDLLKIDTEGCDLDVLKGGQTLLSEQRVCMIEVECAMNPENTLHVPWHSFTEYLQPLGYRLFGIYEQKHEWPAHKPNLRRANLAFMSGSMIDRYFC